MTTYTTWNSCSGLKGFAVETFATLEEAKAFNTPQGRPNRITGSDGAEYVSMFQTGFGGDGYAYWSGPHAVKDLPAEANRPVMNEAATV